MKKVFYLLTVLLGVLFLINNQRMVNAQEIAKKTKAKQEASKAEEVGNKICPVTGEKIDEKMKATYEYQGKIYNFCCTDCVDEFKKDPNKYIKKVEEEKKGKPGNEDSSKIKVLPTNESSHHEHGMMH